MHAALHCDAQPGSPGPQPPQPQRGASRGSVWRCRYGAGSAPWHGRRLKSRCPRTRLHPGTDLVVGSSHSVVTGGAAAGGRSPKCHMEHCANSNTSCTSFGRSPAPTSAGDNPAYSERQPSCRTMLVTASATPRYSGSAPRTPSCTARAVRNQFVSKIACEKDLVTNVAISSICKAVTPRHSDGACRRLSCTGTRYLYS